MELMRELVLTMPVSKNYQKSCVKASFSLSPHLVDLGRVIQLFFSFWMMVSLGPMALADSRPNIIFILADDLGYGHLGSYGQKKIRTAHLDRMASEGVRFTQVYAGNTVCAPSRCVLMTGYHGGHSSVRSNSGAVPLLSDDVTVARVLKRAGYVTGIFGKWGLGDARTTGVPNQQGFDEFYGYLHQVHAHFYYPHFLWKDDRKVFLTGNREDWRKQYSHDLIAEAALDFVRRHKNKPFFLYLPFTIPHSEHLVPRDSLEEYQGKFPEIPFTSELRNHYAPQPTPRAAIAAMITRMDRSVGSVLALLKELGIDDNTIVFFSSDNGPANTDGADPDFFQAAGPFRGYKRDLYEGGIRVPLLVRWPGKVAAGRTSDRVWAFWDFLPTAAELAGVKMAASIDGRSILPSLLSLRNMERVNPPHKFLYWEHPRPAGLAQAVRMGNWKAVRSQPNAPLELYDLDKDPGETKDLATAHPEISTQIMTYLKTARTEPRAQEGTRNADGRSFR